MQSSKDDSRTDVTITVPAVAKALLDHDTQCLQSVRQYFKRDSSSGLIPHQTHTIAGSCLQLLVDTATTESAKLAAVRWLAFCDDLLLCALQHPSCAALKSAIQEFYRHPVGPALSHMAGGVADCADNSLTLLVAWLKMINGAYSAFLACGIDNPMQVSQLLQSEN